MSYLRIARFIGKSVLIVVLLLFGVLCANVFWRAQPTQNVRIDLSESHDRFGTRCVDVYLTNLTSEEVFFSEDILSRNNDFYGGVWSLSAIPDVYAWDIFKVDYSRLELENQGLFWHYSPSSSYLGPGERKRISSIYLLSKQSIPAGTMPVQLGYQPGRELEFSWNQPLPYAEFFDRIFERFPIHHILLARKTYWSNTINVTPIKPSEIKGIDQSWGGASSSI